MWGVLVQISASDDYGVTGQYIRGHAPIHELLMTLPNPAVGRPVLGHGDEYDGRRLRLRPTLHSGHSQTRGGYLLTRFSNKLINGMAT